MELVINNKLYINIVWVIFVYFMCNLTGIIYGR